MKKLKIMIIIIILSFSFFLMIYSKKRSYELSYDNNGFKVFEKYIKEDNKYIIKITKGSESFNFIINDKYHKNRKLVSNIKKYENDDEVCLEIKFNNKNNILPTCKKGNDVISYYLVSKKMKNNFKKRDYQEKVKTSKYSYKNIDVKSLNGKKVLIWNYHGFYYLSDNDKKNIDIVKNDVYNPSLVGQIDNYLVIPNYDQGYEYKSLKIFNVDNFNVSKLSISKNLSGDSYVLGVNDKSIFIYDTKYERELEVVPYKLKYRFLNNLYIYDKGKVVSKTSNALNNNNIAFIYDTDYEYVLDNNKLYRTNKYNSDKELISNKDIKEIVKKDNGEVYYISENSLYSYSDKYGEVEMLEYFELDFNYKNIIYIFN